MKLRKLLFLALALVGMQQILAGPVDFAQARKSAAAFLQKSGRSIDTDEAVIKSNKKVWGGAPAYYVFNAEGEAGFVIVSGDDRTASILGYTDAGAYDATNLPDNFRAWLQSYEAQIEALGSDAGVPVARSTSQTTPHDPAWTAIEPLLQTTWNQYAPYNNLCPEINGQRTLSGCVATALTQIMYYHAWPKEVTTAIPGYTTADGLQVEELQPTILEWDKMPLSENQPDVNNAVAKLTRYVGQAVKMGYGTGASGAYTEDVPGAFATYLGYNKGMYVVSRNACGRAEWHSLGYEELRYNRPVYYAGAAPDVGHAFVCDGYDGNGYYHINWGWGGSSDGYFLLEILNPYGTGAGGSATDEGYSGFQKIIVGLKPDTDNSTTYPQTEVYLSGECTLDGTALTVRFDNASHKVAKFDFGLALVGDDGALNVFHNGTTGDIPMGWGINTDYTISSANSPFNQPGTYRVVPVSREWNKGEAWKQASKANHYVEVVVDEVLNVSAVLHPAPDFSVTSFEAVGDVYAWVEKTLNLTLENRGDEFYGKLYLLGNRDGENAKVLASVITASMTGSAIDMSIPCRIPFSGTWNLVLATDERGNNAFWQSSVEVKDYIAAGQYLLENFRYKHYLSATAAGGMVGLRNAAERSVWNVQFVENGAILQNVETGLYAQPGANISAPWTLQLEPCVLEVYFNDEGRDSTITFGSGGTYFKMHEDGAGNIVNWASQVETSWNFLSYTPEMAEDLAQEEAALLAADKAELSVFDDIAEALGSTYDADEITLKDLAVDGWFYRFFADKFYRFTNNKQKRNIGIDADGLPAGVAVSKKDYLQIWQLVPVPGGFKLCNPNLDAAGGNAYLGSVAEGRAILKPENEATIYNIVPKTRGFNLTDTASVSINMVDSANAAGDFALTGSGRDLLFAAEEVADVEVELSPLADDCAFAASFLPFAVERTGADVNMYVAGSISEGVIELTEAERVKPLNGFLLMADAAQTVLLNVVANDADAAESTLRGTTAPMAVNRATRRNYLLFGEGGEENALGFYVVPSSMKEIPANTAYVDNAEQLYPDGLSLGGVLSGVASVELTPEADATLYDLSGRRVAGGQKGIYISAGRKFVITR